MKYKEVKIVCNICCGTSEIYIEEENRFEPCAYCFDGMISKFYVNSEDFDTIIDDISIGLEARVYG